MIRLLLTTFADQGAATTVVRQMVEEKLAACGTLVPGARSIYAWKGRIEEAEETVVYFKTSAAKLPALAARLKALHPYDTPEIISLDPGHVSARYAAWVAAEVDGTNA